MLKSQNLVCVTSNFDLSPKLALFTWFEKGFFSHFEIFVNSFFTSLHDARQRLKRTYTDNIACPKPVYPASILRKSTSGRHRPVSYPDGPMTARYRFT